MYTNWKCLPNKGGAFPVLLFPQKMRLPPRSEILRFVRFGLVGVLNTAITFVLFWVLRAVSVDIDLANLLSYLAGMINSFVCNKLWVFRNHGKGWKREAAFFFLGTGICWALQWCAFRGMLLILPELLAQLLGMCFYTLLNYLYNRLIAFR